MVFALTQPPADQNNEATSGANRFDDFTPPITPPAKASHAHGILHWVVLSVGIPASIWLCVVLQGAIDNVARLRFERQASDSKGAIEVRINYYANVLYGLKALFASNQTVSRVEFHRFVNSLDLPRLYPGLDVVNFAKYVAASEKERFEETVRNDRSLVASGYPAFAIKPPGQRNEYHVIVYLEPMTGYEFAFGLDLAANPAVSGANPKGLVALQHEARDSGKLTASGLPIRIKAKEDYVGLAMRLAVYQSGMSTETMEERRAAYLGSVGAGFNVQKLMRGAIDDSVARPIRFRLYDVGLAGERSQPSPPGPERLLFDSAASTRETASEQVPQFTRVLPLEVGGRVWQIHFSAPKRSTVEPVDALMPWVVLFGGVLSTLMLSGLFYSLASSRSRALTIAQAITKDLRNSEASLAEAQRMAHLGNWSLDPAVGVMTWSSETFRIFKLEPVSQPVSLERFLQRIHEEDRLLVSNALLSASSGGEQRELEHRIIAADGSIRWVHAIVQRASSEAAAAVSGTMMDITERKRAEQDLLESRALLIDAQKLAHVGYCQYSPADGRVIWSEELYRIHGVSPDAFVASFEAAMALVHPEDRTTWRHVLNDALERGSTFDSEFRIVRPDGTVRTLHSLGEVVKDRAGRPSRMLWSVMDITEQRLTEDALRGSAEQLSALSRRLVEVQEAERRKLSRELHDRVGQNLTALSINLDILRTRLTGTDYVEHRARLRDSAALLEATVDSIEDVMAELRPPMLDDYGLLPALHWYSKDFSRRTGIDVRVSGDEVVERAAPEIEITIFRIAQEALTNVAKHAHAARVQIELCQKHGHCTMTLRDDGIGIDGARKRRHGLGMINMRERTQAVGGTFTVRNIPGGGTQITVDIPSHEHPRTDS